MKTAKTAIEIEVPLVSCRKCGTERPFRPFVAQGPDGRAYVEARPPFAMLHFQGDESFEGVFLCPACTKFVKGALDALGLFGSSNSIPS